jgi:DNA repair exonuclease SbcCD ATPase subunit
VARSDLARAEAAIKAIDGLKAMCPTCGQPIPEQHRAQHRDEAVEAKKNALERIASADERYRKAQDGIDSGAEAALNRLVASVKDRLAQARANREQVVREQESYTTMLRQLNDRHQRLRELEAMHEKETFAADVRGFLSTAFSKSGIPMLVMENVVSEIEHATVEILEAMESQFRIRFRTETASGRDTLQIEIETPDGVRGIRSFSGGQRTEINLAIRLALSEVLSRRADVSFDSIFLDEVMAALDAPARQCFLRVVNLVKRSFSQVYVVSHHPEIRDVLETGMLVTWTPDGSVVEISS